MVTIYLVIHKLHISNFYILSKPHVRIYSILSFVYQSTFYIPNNHMNCQFLKVWDFSTFSLLIYVLCLDLDIQHAFIAFNLISNWLMECFILSKMKILYTFIFTCFLDRFQSVLHQFLDQFFMRIVIFYFHQIYLYSVVHFCQLCLKNCHIFQTFIKFRLLFEFL